MKPPKIRINLPCGLTGKNLFLKEILETKKSDIGVRLTIESRATIKSLWFAILVGSFLLSGCAHQPVTDAYEPAGFFSGIFHGFVVIFSFIGSIFTDIRIYAFPNSGFSYDLGFVIGLLLWVSAISFRSEK